jgi:hypothetical protein
MLVEADIKDYRKYFPDNMNPFITEKFIGLNSHKTDRVVRIVNDCPDPLIGLVAGIRDGVLKSPFSAPFGGFHFKKENIYMGEIDKFIFMLSEYAASSSVDRIEIAIPPDIYNKSFNAKIISSLTRHGFRCNIPEITNWVNLTTFGGEYSQKNSREYYRQAQRNKLRFDKTDDINDKEEIYNLIRNNRAKFGRPIFMTLDEILSMVELWPVDFFKVLSLDDEIVSAAIFYRNHPEISYAVFWGDNDEGRLLRAMDFLLLNLFSFYKKLGYKYIDLGISTENGLPNEGLLRFKESHEAVSSLRFRFIKEFSKG